MAFPAFFAGLAVLLLGSKSARAAFLPVKKPAAASYGPQQSYEVVPRVNARDLDTLARTLWGEAKGEGSTGMQGVANVIMNRYKQRPRYGSTVHDICIRKFQFSVWNAYYPDLRAKYLADPNLRVMVIAYDAMAKVTAADPQFAEALRIAKLALEYRLPDITNGADHYHTPAVRPAWSNGKRPVQVVGNHKFFKLTGGYA